MAAGAGGMRGETGVVGMLWGSVCVAIASVSCVLTVFPLAGAPDSSTASLTSSGQSSNVGPVAGGRCGCECGHSGSGPGGCACMSTPIRVVHATPLPPSGVPEVLVASRASSGHRSSDGLTGGQWNRCDCGTGVQGGCVHDPALLQLPRVSQKPVLSIQPSSFGTDLWPGR